MKYVVKTHFTHFAFFSLNDSNLCLVIEVQITGILCILCISSTLLCKCMQFLHVICKCELNYFLKEFCCSCVQYLKHIWLFTLCCEVVPCTKSTFFLMALNYTFFSFVCAIVTSDIFLYTCASSARQHCSIVQ